MAEITMRQTVLTASLDADPTVREYVKQRLSADLMKSVHLAARFGGETIVSLGPIKESQINDLCSVRFEQSVSLTPLVRCRDCKYHDGIRCFRWNSVIVTRFDDYCSKDERKDGGQDDV